MWYEIISNKILIIPTVAWALTQFLKVMIKFIQKRNFDLRYLVSSGGMPSAHSAMVAGLATSAALIQGFDSAAFAISAILALVIMYDAAGLRQSVGKQSVVLNRVLRELRFRRPVTELGRDLREFMGHTPLQVIIGGLLGILVAWSWLTLDGA